MLQKYRISIGSRCFRWPDCLTRDTATSPPSLMQRTQQNLVADVRRLTSKEARLVGCIQPAAHGSPIILLSLRQNIANRG